MKNKIIVISQPMFFPWVGMFEQILLSDQFIFYDDVQFSKGSFTNRVQIKTETGTKWLTVPLNKMINSDNINKVSILYSKNWKQSHLSFLENTYKNHPFKKDVLDLVNSVYDMKHDNIAELSGATIIKVLEYFNIEKEYLNSSNLPIYTKGSKRVLEIVQYFSGNTYVTGHGAKNYLKHSLFENNNIDVQYMKYKKNHYPQLFADFTPYVSILDLIANQGKDGIKYINSTTINWKEFTNE